jgi:predicted transcriptional regulator of viral defense system
MVSLSVQARVDEAIAALALAQWCVFRLADLVAIGLTGSGVRKRMAAGRLHRLFTGVYSLVPWELLTRNGRWLAAVLACGPGAVLSHRTAAALLDLRRTDSAKIDVTVATRSPRCHPGITIHRSVTLAAIDVTTVEGIPCTTVARTLFDLAEVVSRRGVERAFDQADSMELLDLSKINDQLARNPTRRAAKVVKWLLAEHYVGTTLTRSELEERGLAAFRKVKLPRPVVNEFVDFGDGEHPIHGDFVWRAQRVILELDGYDHHKTRQAFRYDRARQRRAARAGWELLRAVNEDIEHDPDEVAATVHSAIRRRPTTGTPDTIVPGVADDD